VTRSPLDPHGAKLLHVSGGNAVAVLGDSVRVVRFGSFELDLRTRELRKHGLKVKLQDQPLQVLTILLEHAGEVVTREELQQRLWSTDTFVDFEHSLNAAVKKLRQALGDSADNPRFVETLARRGYRFLAPVSGVLIEATGNGAVATSFQPSQEARELKGNNQAGADNQQLPVIGLRPLNREVFAWALVGVLSLGLAVLGAIHFRQPARELRQIRFSVFPPERTELPVGAPFALSPDGGKLAILAAVPGGVRSLWVRRLDSLTAQPLAGTEDANDPFWSPDSRFIAFFAHGKLKTVAVFGGPPQELCTARMELGAGTWGPTGMILFASDRGIQRVAAAGGPPTSVTNVEPSRQEIAHFFPYSLPDGRHFLYLTLKKGREGDGISVGSLDSREARPILRSHWKAEYAGNRFGPGHVLFLRNGTLMAQRFDPERIQLTGEPFAITDIVSPPDPSFNRYPLFSASANGNLCYRIVEETTQLVWFDRTGNDLGTIEMPGDKFVPKISPDGRQLALERYDPQTGKIVIWLVDLARGASTRLTFNKEDDFAPVWSPDGRHVVFASNRSGQSELYMKLASGEGKEELLLHPNYDSYAFPTDWSHDGRYIAYTSTSAKGKQEMWILPIDGDRKPFAFLQTEFDEMYGRFSPDGRWIAYTSNESGKWEVYVRRFKERNAAGGKWQVSTHGGIHPVWQGDGKELFYIAADRKLMAVPVNTIGNTTFNAGIPKVLFDTHTSFSTVLPYAASSDGKRFLVITLSDEKSQPINVLLNWAAELYQ
jgi:Tol biopolymer transport system component/DNA-binding winged helix-turn-helix (wHTH) protein